MGLLPQDIIRLTPRFTVEAGILKSVNLYTPNQETLFPIQLKFPFMESENPEDFITIK